MHSSFVLQLKDFYQILLTYIQKVLCYGRKPYMSVFMLFSWFSLAHAHALVMFPVIFFFLIICIAKVASYKTLLGPFIIYQLCKSWLHLPTAKRFFYFFLRPVCPCISQLPKDSFTSFLGQSAHASPNCQKILLLLS